MTWMYGAKISIDGDDHVVSVRDLPEVLTAGDSRAEALALAQDAIDCVVAHRIAKGLELEPPTALLADEIGVELPLQTAIKAEIYRLWRESGISKSELARRLGVRETEARRLLDPRHGTRIDMMAAAARALGYRLDLAAVAAE